MKRKRKPPKHPKRLMKHRRFLPRWLRHRPVEMGGLLNPPCEGPPVVGGAKDPPVVGGAKDPRSWGGAKDPRSWGGGSGKVDKMNPPPTRSRPLQEGAPRPPRLITFGNQPWRAFLVQGGFTTDLL
ncbi:hypothetical protein RRG08_057358 [Elysia crispata]|uniref:Uncharacterized protein n=1 Tax=Elysia crispata TaxID=231223 RepID=A0AAE0YK55_9GAST|nr:hypothetical protein RRG08_057358 [Elysia crispata]